MKTLEAGGKIEKGKLKIHNKEVFQQAISDIGFVNHVHLKLEYGNKRTLDQNSYLFGGIIEPIRVRLRQDGWNFSSYQCYKYLENRFSKVEMVNENTSEVITAVKPFKELTTEEWDEIVMVDIRQWAQMDLGIYCKMPHEYYEMTLDAYNRWKMGEINKTEAIEMSKKQAI